MKEQFTQGEWLNEGTTVYALQDSTRRGKPIKINRFQFNIQGKCSDEELLANAVLAKAAPKMYKMIKTLIENYQLAASVAEHEGYETRYAQDSELVDLLLAEVRGENSEHNN